MGKCKGVGANKYRAGTGIKGNGKRPTRVAKHVQQVSLCMRITYRYFSNRYTYYTSKLLFYLDFNIVFISGVYPESIFFDMVSE